MTFQYMRNQNKYPLIVVACLHLLSSCGDSAPASIDPTKSDSDQDGVMDYKDHCNGTHMSLVGWPVDSNGCPLPLDVEFVIDGSKSMKGYVSEKTEFLDYLLEVNSNLNNFSNSAEARITRSDSIWSDVDGTLVWGKNRNTDKIVAVGEVAYTMITEPRLQVNNGDLFLETLREKSFEGKESQLDDIFKQLAGGMTDQRLVVMLTDGILSHSSEDVKMDEEINLTKLSVLGGKIQSTFSDYFGVQRGYAMALLAGVSKFNGTYYNYKNDHFENCCQGNRPYYIFLMGQPSAIKFYLTQLNRQSDFIKEAYYFNMNFDSGEGFTTKESTQNCAFKKPSKKQTVMGIDCKHFEESTEKDSVLSISYHVDFSFLANGSAVNAEDVEVIFGDKKIRPSKVETGDASTVAFDVPTEMLRCGSSYHIKVQLNQPTGWLHSWHLSNDKIVDSIGSKTFGLKDLFEGISNGQPKANEGKVILGEGVLELQAINQ